MNGFIDDVYDTGDMAVDADDVVEFVQDLPLINRFNLNGWAASGIVVAVAALSGAWFSKR